MAALLLAAPRPAAADEETERAANLADDEPELGDAIDLAEAKAMFNRGDHRKAALAFDALWDDEQTPVLLYFAAVAWASSGDDTRAILRWRRFLAVAGAETREIARTPEYLREAYKRTTALSLTIEPAGALDENASIELVRLPETSTGGVIQTSLADAGVEGDGQGFELHLGPGSWRVTLADPHPGYNNTSVEIEAVSETGSLQRSLKLSPREGDLEVTITLPSGTQTPFRILLEDAAELEPPREHTIVSGKPLKLRLRRGTWHYRMVDGTDWDASGDVEIDDDLTRLSIAGEDSVHSSGHAHDRAASSRRFSLGLGVSSAAIGAVGIGLIVPTSLMLSENGPRYNSDDIALGLRWLVESDACVTSDAAGGELPEDLDTQANRGDVPRRECVVFRSLKVLQPLGSALIGASLGLATNAVIVRTRMSPRLLSIPAATGLLVGAVGGILFSRTNNKIQEDFTDMTDIFSELTVTDDTVKTGRTLSAAAGLIGLGGGLMVGAGVGLLARRAGRSRRSAQRGSFRLSPTFGGGSLKIDF